VQQCCLSSVSHDEIDSTVIFALPSLQQHAVHTPIGSTAFVPMTSGGATANNANIAINAINNNSDSPIQSNVTTTSNLSASGNNNNNINGNNYSNNRNDLSPSRASKSALEKSQQLLEDATSPPIYSIQYLSEANRLVPIDAGHFPRLKVPQHICAKGEKVLLYGLFDKHVVTIMEEPVKVCSFVLLLLLLLLLLFFFL
jgi:hypothetical protein